MPLSSGWCLSFRLSDQKLLSISHLFHAVTCSAHNIICYLITLMILGQAYKLQGSSLCNLLQPPASSSLLGPHILLSTLFTNTLDVCF